jgi:hypothetical protein
MFVYHLITCIRLGVCWLSPYYIPQSSHISLRSDWSHFDIFFLIDITANQDIMAKDLEGWGRMSDFFRSGVNRAILIVFKINSKRYKIAIMSFEDEDQKQWWHHFEIPAEDDNSYDKPYYDQGVYDSKHRYDKATPAGGHVPLGPPRKKNLPGLRNTVANIQVKRLEFDCIVEDLIHTWALEDKNHVQNMETFRKGFCAKKPHMADLIDEIIEIRNANYESGKRERSAIMQGLCDGIRDSEMVAAHASRVLERRPCYNKEHYTQ